MQCHLTKPTVRCQHPFTGFSPATQCRRVVCKASGQQEARLSRRELLQCSPAVAAAALLLLQAPPAYAGLDRYVKRKKLDPLDTYVPLVLEARERLAGLGTVMVESPTTARQMLRSGPFGGLRDNIRALGQYASTPAEQGGSGLAEKDASQLVAAFFRALEDYDLVLYNAVREFKAAEEKAGKAASKEGEEAAAAAVAAVDAAVGLDKEVAAGKLQVAVEQLDKLIATVPADVLAKSREVLEKVNRKQQAVA